MIAVGLVQTVSEFSGTIRGLDVPPHGIYEFDGLTLKNFAEIIRKDPQKFGKWSGFGSIWVHGPDLPQPKSWTTNME